MCTDSEQQQCVEIENRVRYAYLRGRNVYRIEEVSVHLQTSEFAMCTSQGCFGLFRGRYVYPYLHIYQAGAQRTLGAVAPGSCCASFQGLRPERRELHGAPPMRPLHPMHHVHQCTRFTTAVRLRNQTERARTDTARELLKQIRGIRSETANPLTARDARCHRRDEAEIGGNRNSPRAPATRR